MFDRVNVNTYITIIKGGISMTKGELFCNIGFNPSGDAAVDQLKGATAAIIDNLDRLADQGTEAGRCAKIAQQKYEEACMYAVKALTR